MNQPITLDELIVYLTNHRAEFPDHGKYNIEMREHLLAAQPQKLTHDDHDKVVILVGIHTR